MRDPGAHDQTFPGLLARAQAGDEQAFAVLWRTHNPMIVRFLTGMTNREDALDLASGVWLEVVRNLGRFEGDESGFRAWLFLIARHRLIDLHRAKGRRPVASVVLDGDEDLVGNEPDPAEILAARHGTERALALIGRLSPDQAEVVLLRVVADLDVASVAQIVGKSEGAVRVLCHRGLRRLEAIVDPAPFDPAPIGVR